MYLTYGCKCAQTFEYGRRSTLGADFYTKRVTNPAYGKQGSKGLENGTGSTDKQVSQEPDAQANANETEWDASLTMQTNISLQMWDTAGRERFVSGAAGTLSSCMGDAFFEHADAAVLVYDATSSRSFTQLLRWHAELTDRMRERKQNGENGTTFPMIVVANKLDKVRDEDEKNQPMRRRKVTQREIMNLDNGFKGKDHRYEYKVSSLPKSRSRADSADLLMDRKRRHHHHNHRAQGLLSYGLTDANWTTDNSYLNNIIKSEDGSFPDRDMVILWCRRNGIQHVEVSALDGDGINGAVARMVGLAMEAKNEEKKAERLQREAAEGADAAFLQDYWKSRGYGDEDLPKGRALDLTARYTSKDDTCDCCWFRPFC